MMKCINSIVLYCTVITVGLMGASEDNSNNSSNLESQRIIEYIDQAQATIHNLANDPIGIKLHNAGSFCSNDGSLKTKFAELYATTQYKEFMGTAAKMLIETANLDTNEQAILVNKSIGANNSTNSNGLYCKLMRAAVLTSGLLNHFDSQEQTLEENKAVLAQFEKEEVERKSKCSLMQASEDKGNQ